MGGGHRVPHHRTSRGDVRRHQQDRWGHVHGDPDCPVRFGTHDGRVAYSAHLRKLHSVRFGTHDGRVAHCAHLQKLHSVRFGTHYGRVAHCAHLQKLHSVRFGTHGGRVSRTVPIYESYTLHSAIPAPEPVITCGAPPSLMVHLLGRTRHRQLYPMRFLLLLPLL